MKEINKKILKAIEANEMVIKREESKLSEIRKIKNELIRAYRFQCKGCGDFYELSKFTLIDIYSIDMDGDMVTNGFQYGMLGCPCCKRSTYIYNSSQKKDIIELENKYRSGFRSLFAGYERMETGKIGEWY